MKLPFTRLIILLIFVVSSLSCSINPLLQLSSKTVTTSPAISTTVSPTSATSQGIPGMTPDTPAKKEYPSYPECSNPDLTQEEFANCGEHNYSFKAEVICPEGKMTHPTGTEKGKFIFSQSKLIINAEQIKDADKISKNTYEGNAHTKTGSDWLYHYEFNQNGYTLKTMFSGDADFCFVYHYTLADK